VQIILNGDTTYSLFDITLQRKFKKDAINKGIPKTFERVGSNKKE